MEHFAELSAPMTPREAVIAAGMILECYRHSDVNNRDAFQTALAGILTNYPADIAKTVASPVTGIASRLKFLPSLAEVRDALDAEANKRRRIMMAANWMLKEHERRRAEARERAYFIENEQQARAILEARMAADRDRFVDPYEARK